jgi:hypothetical protein
MRRNAKSTESNKFVLSEAKRSISRNTTRAAAIAASSGFNGDKPPAIKSALTK